MISWRSAPASTQSATCSKSSGVSVPRKTLLSLISWVSTWVAISGVSEDMRLFFWLFRDPSNRFPFFGFFAKLSGNSMPTELPKAYLAAEHEDRLYDAWLATGYFNPDRLPARYQTAKPYTIMMPPPNRTGVLHMGHAAMLAIQDLLIRFERMRGRKALWIPGTDHAAIATQVKVEQLLMKQGMKDPRRELGREAFLEEVVKFAEGSANTIRHQVRKMGSSCDWSREKYTLDEERNRAVNEIFKRLFEDGLIEKGYRLVNWDPQFQTTLSDDEVLTKEVTAKLLTFTYDASFPIPISTTRPETKFGDVAVAVHPTDERYAQYVGQVFHPVFCGKELTIRVVADEAVDPSFGTGALGVTPAHSFIDADLATKHGLETIQVIGKDAHLLEVCGSEFAGLTIEEAREKIQKTLDQTGLLKGVEEIPQNLPIAERGGAPVEQLPMEQWFIRVNKPFSLRQNTLGKWKKGDRVTIKELMQTTVREKHLAIVPERFEQTYFYWVDNLRDWCISRQIWFGHRIPVWYNGAEMRVSDASPGEGWTQDPDTLDTWFSSGLWTFSTLGWPEAASVDAEGNLVKTGELAAYHPTDMLETGRDILPFWVARMILMTVYALGEVPFKTAYLHGLVVDEQGRKMSKSLGNILDPLELIPKYGTDAVRMSLLTGTTPGVDTRLSETKIESLRNFTNKLWNISRFMLGSVEDQAVFAHDQELPAERTLADRWILARFVKISEDVERLISTYQFAQAAEVLREFTWNDLADWYLEIAKIEKKKDILFSILLRGILRLWHPFMPFVTDVIWREVKMGETLMIESYRAPLVVEAEPELFAWLRDAVVDLRRLRADQGVDATKKLAVGFAVPLEKQAAIEQEAAWLGRLMNASSLEVLTGLPEEWVTTVSRAWKVGFSAEGVIDREAENVRIQGELADLERYISSTQEKLQNAEFLNKAPEKVVQTMKNKLEEAESKRAQILDLLNR